MILDVSFQTEQLVNAEIYLKTQATQAPTERFQS